jgi:hypothetical protein
LGDEDPRAPLFFLSYAHSTQGQQSRFIRFFEDLSENVAELVSRSAGSDPGYMDRSMGGGNRWAPELLEAIGTCQVFVALLSAPYFKSTWCSMEWFAFSQRRVIRYSGDGTEHQTAVVPVVWAAPLPHGQAPAVVLDVQLFSPSGLPNADIAGQYQAEGVVGLLQTQVELYQAVVWRLAQRIASIYYSYRVEPRVFRQQELRDIFREREK